MISVYLWLKTAPGLVVSEICVDEKTANACIPRRSGRTTEVCHLIDSPYQALKNLLTDTDLILETTPDLPQNRTACCRENLRVALALVDDLLNQAKGKIPPAALLGHRGGSVTAQKHGPEHYRKMAAARKKRAGGRPRKER